MKTKIIFFAFLVIVTGALISMKALSTQTEGPHGGKLQEAEGYNIEMKTAYSHFSAYLLDKQNMPISNKALTCEIRFFLYDRTTLDIPLKPEGEDGFSIEYYAFDYDSYQITFQVSGKPVMAKFEKENVLVKGK